MRCASGSPRRRWTARRTSTSRGCWRNSSAWVAMMCASFMARVGVARPFTSPRLAGFPRAFAARRKIRATEFDEIVRKHRKILDNVAIGCAIFRASFSFFFRKETLNGRQEEVRCQEEDRRRERGYEAADQ